MESPTRNLPELAASSQADRPRQAGFGLGELFAAVERMTGLRVSIVPAPGAAGVRESISRLPDCYRRHMSAFCQIVRANATGRGCGGHDNKWLNQRAAEVGCAFTQRCHAGVAEVIVPVFGHAGHLATIFVGQAVTEPVEEDGFEGIRRRVEPLGVDMARLKPAFRAVPRMSESDLLRVGQLVEAAARGMAHMLGMEGFEREILLQHHPQVLRAIRLIDQAAPRSVTLAGVARAVHHHPAYFSRLFKRVMGVQFRDYAREQRVRRAGDMLLRTRLSVGDIARACGYSRQSYFTRCFKKVMGTAPLAYRRQQGARARPASGGRS